MSGIFTDLISNARSLNFHAKAVENAGRNLANVNNPDYARQRLLPKERDTILLPDGPQSQGVEVGGLVALRDTLLDRQVQREVARGADMEALLKVRGQLETILGERYHSTSDSGSVDGAVETGAATGSLSYRVDSFFNAWSELSNDPSNAALRDVLLNKTDALTDHIQLIDRRVGDLSGDISDRIDQDVGEANLVLERIRSLNSELGRLRHAPEGSTVNLVTEMEKAYDELSQYMNFEVQKHPSGGGLVQIIGKDAALADVMLVDGIDRAEELSYDGTNLLYGTAQLTLNTGSISGRIEGRSTDIPELEGKLDALTVQVITAVNAAYDPSSIHGNFFNGTDASDIARNPAITAVSLATSDDPTNEGDNAHALAIAELAEHRFTAPGDQIDGTFAGYLAQVTSELGESVSLAQQSYENQQLVESALRTERSAVMGVSMDEEMADMIRFEKAFQATARVMSTLDSMLDTIINRLGR